MVTHPDFCNETADNIIRSKFLEICVMNTTPIDKNFVAKLQKHNKKIKILSVAKLIAQTIDNLHNGASVSALWTKNGN
jgi:phosphoribosylpyrophosphate synthetase